MATIPLRQYWRLLSKYLASQRQQVVLLFLLVLSGIAFQVANPQLIALFIDEALGSARESRLTMLALSFIGLALAAQVFAVISTYLSEKVGWTATNELRADLADHCLRLDMSFHKTRTPGEMIQRVDGDIDALSNFFSQFILYVAGNLVLLSGVLLMLFLEDWRIGTPLAAFALVSLTVLLKLRSLAVPHWVATREKQAQFYGFVAEHLAGREDIRGNGARGYAMSRLRQFFREWMPLEIRSQVFSFGWIWAASQGVYTLGTVIALVLSYLLWESGALTVGSVYLIFHYNEMIRRPLDQIRDQINQLQAASASIVRVQELLQIPDRIPDEGNTLLPAGSLSLQMSGVSFSYEGDDAVLRDISVRLQPGEVLGLIGRTGSGKTTIGRLLVRLYDIDAGEIALGGVPIRETPLSDLRSRVCVVTQDVQLFEGSVRDNLTFFDPTISDERLRTALELLGLESWLQALPAGLDTEIGADMLSAGQAQLLACGRVFLRDPGLVVLDEATSRLDPVTQRLVDQAVGKLLAGRTAIIIAHRLATIDSADQVLLLQDGRAVESGRYKDLIADENSLFSRLHSMDMETQLA